MTREEVNELADREDIELICFDQFDQAIVGIGRRSQGETAVVYDYEKCVKILMKTNKWSRFDAVEWMEFNVVSAWLGDSTPIFLYKH